MKRNLIVLLAWIATQIVLAKPSLAETNAAENAAIGKNENQESCLTSW